METFGVRPLILFTFCRQSAKLGWRRWRQNGSRFLTTPDAADQAYPPSGDTIGIEIPPWVKQAIRLDDKPSWVIVSEHNIDEWPNGGLSPLPGRRSDQFSYGFIPLGLSAKIKAAFLELAKSSRSAAVRR